MLLLVDYSSLLYRAFFSMSDDVPAHAVHGFLNMLARIVALVAGIATAYAGREGWAFIGTFACIALAVAGLFVALFPDVMPSTTDPAFSLTSTNAAATDYTLKVMTIVAAIFTPIVLGYQAWTYWVFRKRIAEHHISDEKLEAVA